jgi:hypothetical protein
MRHDTRRIAMLLAALAAVTTLGAGCGVINKVRQAVHNVHTNKETVDAFTQNLQSNQDSAFEATYMTTGSSPATVVYAVDPASKGMAFHETQTGASASNLQVIVNSSGEYVCNQSGSGGAWTCRKTRYGRRRVGEQGLRLLHAGALGRLPSGPVAGGGPDRRHGDVLDDVGQRLRHELRRPGRQGGAGYEHDLLDLAGHPRVRQSRLELHQLRDHELLVVPRSLPLPAAPGSDGQHGPDHVHDHDHVDLSVAATGTDPQDERHP